MIDVASPEGYRHCWNPSSEQTLADFLTEHKPSSIRNDPKNTKPYIWVTTTSEKDQYTVPKEAIKEAAAILKDISEKVAAVQADSDIPIRANKKKGLRSKKEVREEIQAQAKEQLKEVAIKHNAVSGKWLAFAGGYQTNALFAHLAESLVGGELSHTKAYQVRISTLPADDEGAGEVRHNMEVYFPSVYNEEMARSVMKTLLRNHGLKLSGAKPDLYTAVGLDSKHASGIPSTVWKGNGGAESLLTEKEVAELRNAYYREQDAMKASGGGGTEPTKKTGPVVAKNKTTAEDENPFVSDEEEDAGATTMKANVSHVKPSAPAKKGKPAARKRPLTDSESEGDTKRHAKKAAKSSAGAAPAKGTRTKGSAAGKKGADSDSE